MVGDVREAIRRKVRDILKRFFTEPLGGRAATATASPSVGRQYTLGSQAEHEALDSFIDSNLAGWEAQNMMEHIITQVLSLQNARNRSQPDNIATIDRHLTRSTQSG